MPSRRQLVAAMSFKTVTRPRRIAKSNIDTIIQQATSSTPHRLASEVALQLDTMDINSLVDGFAARFQEIDDIMQNNLLEMRQSNTEIFSQIMERLDTIYSPAVLSVTSVVEIGFSNILSRWAWIEQSVMESIANG